MDSGFSIQLRERICQEPGVESCFSPNLTKVLMYRVASLPGPFLCQSDAPFPKKAGACNGKRPVVISPVKQSTFWGRGNKSHLWSTPGLQGIPDPLQFPSPLEFKLCAFDHLLGLKIFYAKSFQVPEFKDRGADTFLASGTLPSSYSASPPVWVGRTEAGLAAVSPLLGDTKPLEIAPEPPYRPGGSWTPPLLSASGPGPLPTRGLYIHFVSSAFSLLHACFTLQPK